MNHLGRLHRKLLEQFLIVQAEGIYPVRIHIQDTTHLAIDLQRHGQFRTHPAPRGDVTRVLFHVTDPRGFAGARDPAGNAFADAQLEPCRRCRQIL